MSKTPHKIQFMGQLPENNVGIALSGGHDSMAIMDFLLRNQKRELSAFFFHHGTDDSEQAYQFVKQYCQEHNIELTTGSLSRKKTTGESPEEFWRQQRLSFLKQFNDISMITGHNLDDAVETYIFNSINGKSHTMPYQNANIIRPFLLTRKATLKLWCENKNVPYIEDQTNMDVHYARNRIRHNLMPEILKINPGIYKVVEKQIKQDFDSSNNISVKNHHNYTKNNLKLKS